MTDYTIKYGDTLGALARRFGMSVNDLARMNNIGNPNNIRAGQVLHYGNSAPAPTPAAAPRTPTVEDWLAGDATYQNQLANYQKSQQDYDTQYNRQIQDRNREYEQTNRQMGQQAVQDRENQMNDYAGRGTLNSGVYAKALSDYNTDFNTKVQNLMQGKTDTLNNMADARTNYLRQLQAEQDAAKQDAIRRRAQQLGV